MSLRLVNWNVEWATPNSRRTPEIVSRIDRHAPEVACLTEIHVGLLSQRWHIICSQPDYGYRVKEGRRKVVLWSREPWNQVDDLGVNSMPPGRFVAGVTQTSLGHVTVIGVCAPWFGSRTEARRGLDRKVQWGDHEQFLAGLTDILGRRSVEGLIVMGDFNQTIGTIGRAPLELQMVLQNTIPPSMSIVTSDLAFQGRRNIDHIALSEDLTVESLDIISNIHDRMHLSDHFGVVAEVSGRHSSRSCTGADRRSTH